jgi:broad specificity polyphosphatase/5'/3'-nucleotidase SurE
MSRTFFTLAIVTGAVLVAAPARPHHSFAAEFDLEQPIKLRGIVTEVEFMNPHSWIHIDVRNDDGTVEKWAIEGGTPNTLFRMGINQNSLKPGTEIFVDGYRSRDGANRANGRDVTLPDGRKVFLGGSAPPQ